MNAQIVALRQHWAVVFASNGLLALITIGAVVVWSFHRFEPLLPRAIRVAIAPELHWLTVWLAPVFVLAVCLLVVVNVSVWQLS